MNNRRKLVIALGASFTAPFAAFGQQPTKVSRVGFLSLRSRPDALDSDIFGAFQGGMRELGYVEGKNLVIEWRFADGKVERLPDLAAELVRLKVDVILATSTPTTTAAQKATTTVPIVMTPVGDPVGSGFVKSLARPGGNITGLSNLVGDLGSKHLEMLLSMVPKLSRVAVLMNANNSSHATILKSVQAAAQRANIKVLPLEIRNPQEIENAFSVITKERAGAVILAQDSLFTQQRHQIGERAAKQRLPSVASFREYVEGGGLMSYGQNVANGFRDAAKYVDKILKGARPGDLPVEQPTKFELFINHNTAKALGLTIPQSLLISADKVIE